MGNKSSKRNNSYKVTQIDTIKSSANNNNNNNNHLNNTTNNNVDKPKLIVPETVTNNSNVVSSENNLPEIDKSALVPKWVNEELFEDVLKETVPNFEKIINFKAYPALGAGENYATLMLRVAIDVQLKDNSQKEVSFMLKVAHDNEQMLQMLDAWNFFITENGMYFDVIPLLEKMYKDKGLDICFAAKGYRFKKDPGVPTVLLQDLRPLGFKNADRRKCLNMEHCKAVLKKLAQFHAASATYVRKIQPLDDIFMNGIADPNSPAVKAIFEGMVGSFKTGFLENMHNFKDHEIYKDLVAQQLEHMTESFFVGKGKIEEFSVLNHGDCWSNNILFKYSNEGELEETYFVDLQMSQFGSPAQDLLYFIMSSAQVDIKTSKFDYFIRYYHEELVHHLKFLEYPLPLPTLRDLHMQILKYGQWGLVTSVMTLAAVLLDPNENAKLENFMSDDQGGKALKNLFYTNPRYIEHINEILPFLHNRGLLEKYIVSPAKVEPKNLTVEVPVVTKIEEDTTKVEKPDWLTEEIFHDILRSKHSNFKQIKDFKVAAGSNAGDNYASTILSVNIKSELEDNSCVEDTFMLKVSLESEASAALMAFFDVFEKETLMYNEVLPSFEQIFKEAGLDVTFGPQSYRFTKDPGFKYVIMDNLKPQGFKNEDRLVGLDLDHTKAVLNKLAQLHAASAVFVHKKGYFKEAFNKSMFSEETRAMMEAMGEKFYPIFLDIVKTYEDSDEFYDKLVPLDKTFHDIMIDVMKTNPDGFNVLNHGDCWTNNILFQHDADGKIKNTTMIDFQMSQYGSPAQDLYYFLLSSPILDVKIEHFDYCIKYYHDKLQENLKALKYEGRIPNLKELHMELIEKGAWGCSVVTGVLAAVLVPPTKHASIDSWMSEDEVGVNFKKSMYNNATYRQHATAIFKWLNKRGLLEYGLEYKAIKARSSIPQWVNKDNFKDLLENNVENFSRVKHFDAEIATKGGDNYASLMLRVKIEAEMKDGSSKNLRYMLKIPLEAEILALWNLYPKERLMYKKYIPAFEQLYKEAGKPLKIAPAYYQFIHDVGCEPLVLEDLGAEGFRLEDRMVGLDETHAKAALKKLAELHAASARYFELHGEYDEILLKNVATEENVPFYDDMINANEDAFLECSAVYKNNEDYIHKLGGLRNKLIRKCVELNITDRSEFNVLQHGDSWLNNIMFQHDSQGNIKETLYIDFQVSKYGSPALDLWYFLMTSTQLDVKANKFDDLIKYYHEQLIESLQLLKYEGKPPLYEDLQETIHRWGYHGVLSFVGVCGVALSEPNENAKIENFTGQTEEAKDFQRKLFNNERYTAHAELIYPWFNSRGYFDL